MENYNELLELLMEAVKNNVSLNKDNGSIPVGISNRHIHLSQVDLNILFGESYELTKIKELSQPGQYACKETLIVCGPKGAIEKVRILGPVRPETQIEILKSDCFKLGIDTPIRMSGDLRGSSGVSLVGPKGSLYKVEGLIVAQRHIHMTTEDALLFGVADGEYVEIKIDGPRGGTYQNVAIRANGASSLECHIDTEEANAMNLSSTSKITIIKQ